MRIHANAGAPPQLRLGLQATPEQEQAPTSLEGSLDAFAGCAVALTKNDEENGGTYADLRIRASGMVQPLRGSRTGRDGSATPWASTRW